MKTLKKGDFYLVISIIIIILSMYFYKQNHNYEGAVIEIYYEDSLYGCFDLNTDNDIEIEKNGVVCNVISIKDGFAYMKSASCPDKYCTRQQKISLSSESICCLPNRVFICVRNEENQFDAIAQ